MQGLAGRYITAEDVGTSVKDMEWVRMETEYVTGLSRALGGGGDPGPVTALGTFAGIKATVKKQLGKDSLEGLKVAVQGAGHVGYHLTKHLKEAGAKIWVSDLDSQALKLVIDDFKVNTIDVNEIYDADVDIYSPCAMGATLNDKTIPRLKCSMVAGSANNQLKDEIKHSQLLKEKNILYAPDYAINAGGLINCANEIEGYNRKRAFKHAEGIYDTLISIYSRSDKDNLTTYEAALSEAKKRINDISKLKNIYISRNNFMGKRDKSDLHPRRKSRESVLKALYAYSNQDENPMLVLKRVLSLISMKSSNDSSYIEKLYSLVLNNNELTDKLIKKNLKNWKFNRVAQLDKILSKNGNM